MEINKLTKIYAIAGVNLISGGPLKIFNSILNSLSKVADGNAIFYIITSNHSVIDEELRNNKSFYIYEMPWACSNIVSRLFFEYIYLFFWSRLKSVHLWLSLNDVTPNVFANYRIAYFHNPSPFAPFKKMVTKNIFFVLYGLLYNFVYLINIRKNNFVIVQQNWMAKIVLKRYRPRCIITALPIINDKDFIKNKNLNIIDSKTHFCYPAFPRFFKNHEIITEAVILLKYMGYSNFVVTFTINGNENKYSSFIKEKYGHIDNIDFVGLLNNSEMINLYSKSDVLIFPSLLETWGLPITEFKAFGKPMLVADRPYARETVGCYSSVFFFNPFNSHELADLMAKVIDKTIIYEHTKVMDVYDCIDFDSLAERIISL